MVILAGLAICLAASRCLGGVAQLGQLYPNPVSFISGLTFDNDPNPVDLDAIWTLNRVDKSNASVITSNASAPAGSFGQSLVYDPTTGYYYSAGAANSLVRIDPVTFAHVTVGSFGTTFNFIGLAVDSSGTLWLGADHNSNEELWKVNKITGLASFQRPIIFPDGHSQLHTMTIGSDGTFYAAARSISDAEGIYRIDPNTGLAPFVTGISSSFQDTLLALAQDPMTKDYYGVLGNNSSSGSTFYLEEITGIPEPAYGLAIGLATLLLTRRRR